MTTTYTESPPPDLAALAGKYLTFQLGDESFGVPVTKVQEIIRLPPITPVPHMPAHVRGVTNLRGRVIPVVDLRARLGLPPLATAPRTCMIVVHLRLATGGQSSVGLIVDAVEEVLLFGLAELESPPDLDHAAPASPTHLLGLAKFRGTVKALLNIDSLILGTSTSVLPATR